MEQLHELKMEFNGTKFSMRLTESELEVLEKETKNMNEYLQEDGKEADWTIYSAIGSAICDGIIMLKRKQKSEKEKETASAGAEAASAGQA